MIPQRALLPALLASLLAAAACNSRDAYPGQPAAGSQPVPPAQVLDFARLYGQNCAGCHGTDGKGGVALGLANPVYLAIADDAAISRITAQGVPGTAMPAFADSSGGMLTPAQINAVVQGIRTRWSNPGALGGAAPPPYAAPHPGDPKHGASVYATFCSSCHGADGRGSQRASSIVDGSFLALVSDQGLRTTIIAGRPDLNAPDWRNDVPGKPMSADDVSDVVAWLAAQRPVVAGQPYSSAVQSGGGLP
jgi:cytochrome c oxidase cbb3-type subunit III